MNEDSPLPVGLPAVRQKRSRPAFNTGWITPAVGVMWSAKLSQIGVSAAGNVEPFIDFPGGSVGHAIGRYRWFHYGPGVAGGPAQPNAEETIIDIAYSALLLGRPDHIVRRGGNLKKYRPFEKIPGLFRLFSKLAVTPEGLLNFVTRFGPMLPNGNWHDGEDAVTGLVAAKTMAELLDDYAQNPRACALRFGEQGLGWSRIDVRLAFIPATGRPQFRFTPPSLLNAL